MVIFDICSQYIHRRSEFTRAGSSEVEDACVDAVRACHCLCIALLMKYPATMTQGVSVIEDHRGVDANTLRQMTTPAARQLCKAFVNSFPLHWGTVYMVGMPWFLKGLVSGLSGLAPLLPKALRKNVVACSLKQLRNHIDEGSLGAELGGREGTFDIDAWVAGLPTRT